MSIEDEIAAKQAEVKTAVRVCADAAYRASDLWRELGNQLRDGEAPETISDHRVSVAGADYVAAAEGLRRRRDELATLAKPRRVETRWR